MSKVEEEREGTSPQDEENYRIDFVLPNIQARSSGILQSADPAEKAANEHKERLYKAIAMLSDFTDGFSNIAPEEFKIRPEEIADQTEEMKNYRIELLQRKNKETEEILSESPASWFARRCKREKQKDPYFNRSAYARAERTRSEGVREHIKNIPGWNDFVGDQPVYKNIEKYIQFLDDLLEGKVTSVVEYTFKGKYSPSHMDSVRQDLEKEGFIMKITKGDFEYLFSEKEVHGKMKKIQFLEDKRLANLMFRELVHDYMGVKNYLSIANKCLTFPGYPRRKLDSNTGFPNEDKKKGPTDMGKGTRSSSSLNQP